MTPLTWWHRVYFAAVGLLALRVGWAGTFDPGHVGEMIPWQVPPLHARFLGAMYLSGVTFMVGALFAKRWGEVRAVVPMIAIWTGMLFVVSLFHLEQFDFGLRQVWVWFGSYLAYPLIAAWLAWHHRADGGHPAGSPPVPDWARRVLRAVSAPLILAAAALLAAPSAMVALWPWKATPLLLQLYGAPLLSYGVGCLLLARQRVWAEVRIAAVAIFVFLALVLAASILHRQVFSAAENPDRLWFAAFGLGTATLAVLALRALVAGRAPAGQ
jgi:hypothetical protein